LLEICQKK